MRQALLLSALLLGAAPAHAVPDGTPTKAAGTAAVTSPQAIPIEHVFRAADELVGPLRQAGAVADADPAIEKIEGRLDGAGREGQALRVELETQRLQEASAREIERLRQAVAREDLLLADAQAVLERRSEQLADAAKELQDRQATWRLTGEAAQRDGAPAAVLRRVAQVEESLREAAGRLRARSERILGIQARVSDQRAEVSRISGVLDDADDTLKRQLFEVESAPLWRAIGGPSRAGTLAAQLRQALRESGHDIASFLADAGLRPWLHLAVILLLGLALRALRRPVAAMAVADPALAGASAALVRPWSAAILLSVLVARELYPPLAPALADLLFLLLLAPLLRLLPGLVPARFRRPLQGFAVLYALDRVAALAPPSTLLARLAVLVVTLGALAGLLAGLRPAGWARFERAGPWGVAARTAAVASAALLAVSAISNLVGNATLAWRLTHAIVSGAMLGIALLGMLTVLEGVLAGLLHLPTLQRRPLVATHRGLLLQRASALLRVTATVFWAWRTTEGFGIWDGAAEAAGAVLGFRLLVGGLDVSLGNVVAFAVTLALAVALSRTVRFLLDEGLFAEVVLPRGIPAAISTTVQYALLLLGFSWAVLASGMEMSRFSFLVGALGVGIGFGLQNVVNNFVSGLILLYERPIQVRDLVEVGTVSGEVTRIGVRSSTVRTFAGAEVIVPNATLISTEVTNWTLSDRRRRVELSLGVAYGTPPQQVIGLLLAAVHGRDGVLDEPAPLALFLRFGESSIDFVLRFWTMQDAWPQLSSDVTIEVYTALGRAGIEIPFPQRDLRVRSIDAAAAERLAAGTQDPKA